jgi:hypothetical protein
MDVCVVFVVRTVAWNVKVTWRTKGFKQYKNGSKGKNPGQATKTKSQIKSVWDLWWTKWHWDRFFSELSVFPCRFHSNCKNLVKILLIHLSS